MHILQLVPHEGEWPASRFGRNIRLEIALVAIYIEWCVSPKIATAPGLIAVKIQPSSEIEVT